MRTFAVSEVAPCTTPLPAITLKRLLAARAVGRIEAAGANQDHLVRAARDEWFDATHPVIEAVHTAFAWHYPLVLGPDDVWLCIAQGFGLHVEANPEALRSRFVRHEGKCTLTIRRDEFVKGSPHNDWQGCFSELSDQIAAHIGKRRDLVVASFSTTGPIERAASEIVLLSAMKSYFDARLVTLCGIPSITLLGTVEDWRAIRRRAEVLAEFDLGSWVAALLPVLDEFVAAAEGDAKIQFWRSIYKEDGRSGGPYITGWINVLFPYLDQGQYDEHYQERSTVAPRPNRWAAEWKSGGKRLEGPTVTTLPRGMSLAPFTWEYLGTELPMMFRGGFCGITQDPQTMAVRPVIGWVVYRAAIL